MIEIITLTTTWGFQDFYGNIFQHLLEKELQVKTVALSHSIPKYNNYEAAWQVKNASQFIDCPALHIIETESFYASNQDRIIIHKGDQLFLCKNNGIASLLDCENATVYEIEGVSGSSIPNLLTQAKTAITSLKQLSLAKQIKETTLPSAFEEPQAITGIILYIDAQGHLHTNITSSELAKKGWDIKNVNVLTKKINQIPFLLDKPKDLLLKSNDAILGFNLEDKLFLYFQQGDGASILGLSQGDYVKITHNQL